MNGKILWSGFVLSKMGERMIKSFWHLISAETTLNHKVGQLKLCHLTWGELDNTINWYPLKFCKCKFILYRKAKALVSYKNILKSKQGTEHSSQHVWVDISVPHFLDLSPNVLFPLTWIIDLRNYHDRWTNLFFSKNLFPAPCCNI